MPVVFDYCEFRVPFRGHLTRKGQEKLRMSSGILPKHWWLLQMPIVARFLRISKMTIIRA